MGVRVPNAPPEINRRLRARAMVLALRYTALRLGDVAMLARDRVTRDGKRWRIFLRTEKSGKPVFLPIPAELKDALDLVPLPRGCDGESKHFFWNAVSSECSMKSVVERCPRSAFRKSGVHARQARIDELMELVHVGAHWKSEAGATVQ